MGKLGLIVQLLALLLSMALAIVAWADPALAHLVVGLFRSRLLLAGSGLGVLTLLAHVWFWRRHAGYRRALAAAGGLLSLAAVAILISRLPAYERERVSFPANDIALAGELYLPASAAPHPGVVLVHGSAPFPRSFYHYWADGLARQGLAVLLVDKRGVGASGGDFESENNGSLENLQRLADDVAAGVAYVAGRDEIDTARIGLFGISQAGWVGVLAARRSDVAFLIMITAPTVSVGEEGAWSRMRGDDMAEAQNSFVEAEALMRVAEPSGYDPREDVAALEVPGLWLFGSEDNSIPTTQCIAVLDELAYGGRAFSHVSYPHAGHILLGARRGPAPLRMPATFWPDVARWLQEHAIAP